MDANKLQLEGKYGKMLQEKERMEKERQEEIGKTLMEAATNGKGLLYMVSYAISYC